MDRLLHDCAWAEAHALMELVGHNFREEEQREVFAAFYRASRAGIEAYRSQSEMEGRRLRPSVN